MMMDYNSSRHSQWEVPRNVDLETRVWANVRNVPFVSNRTCAQNAFGIFWTCKYL